MPDLFIAYLTIFTYYAYKKQVNALGAGQLSIIEIIKQVAGGNIKITSDILVQTFIASLMVQKQVAVDTHNKKVETV